MGMINLYTIPIWETEYPEFERVKESFSKGVEEYFLESERNKETHKIYNSTINGKTTHRALHSHHALTPLFQFACEYAMMTADHMKFKPRDVFIVSSWADINDTREAMNAQHIQSETLSGVFYLKVPPKSGKLCLVNPGINPMWIGQDLVDEKTALTASTVKIEPIEGQMYFYPSYLPHWVEPNQHDDTRISIAFTIAMVAHDGSGSDVHGWRNN